MCSVSSTILREEKRGKGRFVSQVCVRAYPLCQLCLLAGLVPGRDGRGTEMGYKAQAELCAECESKHFTLRLVCSEEEKKLST